MARASGAAAAAAGLALLAAGCGGGGGGGGSQTEQAARAATKYAHAFGAGDGKQACGLLTPGAQAGFVRRVSALVGTRDCVEAVTKLQAVAGPDVTGPFQEATVGNVRVSGDTATAKMVAGGHAEQVRLEKRDGRWLLSRVPGT